MSVRRRTTAYRDIRRRRVTGLKMTIRDALLILRAIIRVTLITTLSNMLLLIKKMKIKI
jgi:hypothetical protein